MKRVLILVTLALAACGNNENKNNDTPKEDMTTDMVMVDMSEDLTKDMPVDTSKDMPDMCVPKTSCDEGVCGMAEDGCGGQIDCGACVCTDGKTADTVSCGVCDLGIVTCGMNENGSGQCNLPEIPGLDGSSCEQRLVYVDASVAASGDGSATTPYKTYEEARASIKPGQVIILANNAPFTETFVLSNGNHVLGGFKNNNGTWTYDEQPTKLEVQGRDTTHVWGVVAQDITIETLLYRLNITTADVRARSKNSIGVVALNSKLILDNVYVKAGKGGIGEDGEDGLIGAVGGDGEKAKDGEVGNNPNNNTLTMSPGMAAGGRNQICPGRSGGDGGDGGGRLQGGSTVFPGTGNTGQGVGGGGGGSQANKDGRTGMAGADGVDGMPIEPQVSLDNGSLLIKGDGTDGLDGQPGAGGGGGAGAPIYEYMLNGMPMWSWGQSGGGGGAGGCPGTGATGGKVGGGSFGVALANSTVVIRDSELNSSFGGRGGKGGQGGEGGQGGAGGNISNQTFVYDNFGRTVEFVLDGGRGGSGGNGGRGGHGAGGAGGPSFGLLCLNSTVTKTNVTMRTDGQANGGASLGNEGKLGLFGEELGCN